jgi:hypothetical protein
VSAASRYLDTDRAHDRYFEWCAEHQREPEVDAWAEFEALVAAEFADADENGTRS